MTNIEEGMGDQVSASSMKGGCFNALYKSSGRELRRWPNPSMARYIYGLIFLVTNILAWMARDYSHAAVLFQLEELQGCHGDKDCLGTRGVLRVSLGCFLFFFIMCLSTSGTKKLSEPRNSWQTSWWLVKILLWLACILMPFFIPLALVHLFGKVAHAGAGQVQVLLTTVVSYVASFSATGLLYAWYASYASCKYNILFITSTLALLLLITFSSYKSNVTEGFLTSGLMGSYLVFICWCAIRSEPKGSCNQKVEVAANADWVTIICSVIAIVVIVVSAFAIGTDSESFQLNSEEAAEDDVPYGYGFFHFIFAMAATYFTMLVIGWDTHRAMPKRTIDVGWANTWVRVINEWLTAAVYIWKMTAPSFWINGRNVQTQ